MMARLGVLVLLLFAVVAPQIDAAVIKSVIDLSHSITPEMPVSSKRVVNPVFEQTFIREDDRQSQQWDASGIFYRDVKQRFCSYEDVGTNLITSLKYNSTLSGKTVERYPVDSLAGLLLKINSKDMKDIDKGQVENWEKEHGSIPPKSIVVMHSGWSENFADINKYQNEPYPGFTFDACEYLAERNVSGVGVDTLHVDGYKVGQTTHPCREYLATEAPDVYILENLNNLDKIQEISHVFVGALKMYNGFAAPARVLAVTFEQTQ